MVSVYNMIKLKKCDNSQKYSIEGERYDNSERRVFE